LAYNTITVDGTAGNTTVDISNLTSAHRIVFNTGGTGDTVVGTLRPQDVINGSVMGGAATTSVGQTDSQPLHAFLSQDWQDFAGTGSLLYRGGSSKFASIDNAVNAHSDWTMGAIHTMPAHTSVELYQDLAPLAGFAGIGGLAGVNNVVPVESHDHWANASTYHAPVKWLSDDDMFNHFVHDVNGHFIP
jgi:hypothetical protein